MTRWAWILAVVGALALGVVILSADDTLQVDKKKPTRDLRTNAQIALGFDTEEVLLAEKGSRYRQVVIRDASHEGVREFKRNNPDTDIYMYKDLSWVLIDEGCEWAPYTGGGVDWCEMKDSWFLRDKQGDKIISNGYDYLYAADISNRDYQNKFIDNALKRLKDAQGDGSGVRWDGIYLDDTNLYPGHGMDGRIQGMSDADYRRATVDFIDRISAAMHREGFKVMSNVGMDPWETEQLNALWEISKDLDYVQREYFMRYWDAAAEEGALFTDEPGEDVAGWNMAIHMMKGVQKRGARYQAMNYGMPNEKGAQIYAKASFLLAWKPGSVFLWRPNDKADGWNKTWTRDLGEARNKMSRRGVGWTRRFKEGRVIVNPSANNGQAFRFQNRFRFRGKCTSKMFLRPTKGAIMKKCGR